MSTLLLAFLASPANAGQPRIVNGTDAGPNEFPEVVGLRIEGASGNGICTGSLIHPEWVLTAAHCFDSVSLEDDPSGGATVIFGNNMTSPEFEVTSSEAHVHPQYVALPSDPAPLNGLGAYPVVDGYETMTNDVAVIRLSEPVERTPMALNDQPLTDDWIGRDVTNIGFGITIFGGSDSGIKRYTDTPIYSYTEAWSATEPTFNGSVSFLDLEEGRSTCQGDSGGPGVYRQEGAGGGYAQVGITSYGIECGASVSTDMRVDLYIPWIEETTGIQVLTASIRPAKFECSHQLNPGEVTSIAIGTVPLDLQCVVDSGDPETITNVEWSWGDGSAPEDIAADPNDPSSLEVSHVYDEMGVYSVRACIQGVRGVDEETGFEGLEYEDCVLKQSHVNACAVPEVSFEATPVEGLQIDVRNTTSLRAHNCVSNATWEVYSGTDINGEPLLSLSGWEPELNLDEVGTYTVVLNVGGLAGTGAAMATVEVGRGAGCSNTGMAPMFAPLVFLPLLGLRRRQD